MPEHTAQPTRWLSPKPGWKGVAGLRTQAEVDRWATGTYCANGVTDLFFDLSPTEPISLADSLGLSWEKCDACGNRYPDVYWADDAQWEAVVGGLFDGLRCPSCFAREAAGHGFTPKMEVLKPPLNRLSLVIVSGGESPMHPAWVRDIRDKCASAGVTFSFRGWGKWIGPGACETDPPLPPESVGPDRTRYVFPDGRVLPLGEGHNPTGATLMIHVGSARSGDLLDGVRHPVPEGF